MMSVSSFARILTITVSTSTTLISIPILQCRKILSSVVICPTPPSLRFKGCRQTNAGVSGQNLTVTAGGTVSKEIEAGAHLHVKVLWNTFITLFDKDLDLCDSVHEVNLTCPLKKGVLNITKEVKIPQTIPPGNFLVSADLYMNDPKEEITCLEGQIKF